MLKSGSMLLQLYRSLNEAKHSSLRRAAILKNEMDSKSYLSQMEVFLLTKYKIEDKLTLENLKEAQKVRFYNDIKGKTYYSKLFRAQEYEIVNVNASSTWMQKGNNQARSEGIYCFLQDSKVFLGQEVQCPHCRKHRKTADHLATKCDRMLGHDYMKRHNEVVRCLHLLMAKKYEFTRSTKVRTHSVQEVMTNDNAEIRVDTRVATDVKVAHNKPEILIMDRRGRKS
ncbi:hypothetical protein NGRA_2600 [Nosema granulosis]|uniref:Uncharacterized protein n=1 Tax=Nosema granulosis TaxID=83296 RepID=A0A9P6GWT2_9MICR|nr:hypothetical protein NGRA_2600 [Nosema granulosis]